MKVIIKMRAAPSLNLWGAQVVRRQRWRSPLQRFVHLGPKSQKAEVDKIKAAIQKMTKEKWAPRRSTSSRPCRPRATCVCRTAPRRASTTASRAWSTCRRATKARPRVLDRDKSPLTQSDGRPYSGCYVNVSIDIWAQDNKFGKRVNAKLLAVQFHADGEAFSGGEGLMPTPTSTTRAAATKAAARPTTATVSLFDRQCRSWPRVNPKSRTAQVVRQSHRHQLWSPTWQPSRTLTIGKSVTYRTSVGTEGRARSPTSRPRTAAHGSRSTTRAATRSSSCAPPGAVMSSMPVVRQGVPCHLTPNAAVAPVVGYPFGQMAIGDSFDVKLRKAKTAASSPSGSAQPLQRGAADWRSVGFVVRVMPA